MTDPRHLDHAKAVLSRLLPDSAEASAIKSLLGVIERQGRERDELRRVLTRFVSDEGEFWIDYSSPRYPTCVSCAEPVEVLYEKHPNPQGGRARTGLIVTHADDCLILEAQRLLGLVE